MKIYAAFLASTLSLLPLTEALGARLEAEAPIVAVTVFPDRAQVSRAVEVTLPAGATTLAVGGLPASLLVETLRVEGQGAAGLQIGSVEARKVFAAEVVQEEERRLRRELEELRDLVRVQDDNVAAARMVLEFIAALGREVPRTESEDIARGEVDPERWQSAWSAIGQGAADAFTRVSQADAEKRGLQRKIQQKERELAQIRTGRRASLEALVKLDAPADGKARLSLSYQMPGASWRNAFRMRRAP